MQEERAMIIRMVEEGKITADQGLALLEALEQPRPQTPAASATEQKHEHEVSVRGQAAEWTSSFDASGIERIEFTANEGSIHYQTWDQPHAEVKVTLTARNGWSAPDLKDRLDRSVFVSRSEEQYIWKLEPADWERDRELKNGEIAIAIHVPRAQRFEHFKAVTNNGEIHIAELLSEQAEIATDNGAITMNGIELEALKTTSVNGAIKLVSGRMESAELRTKNGKIHASGKFESLHCHSSNGEIKLDDLVAEGIDLHAENGNIDADAAFEQLACKTRNGAVHVYVRCSGETERRRAAFNGGVLTKLQAESHNGAVHIAYEEGVAGVRGELKFGHGRASCLLNGETFADLTGDGDNRTLAIRQGDEAHHQLDVTTSNGSIKVETVPAKILLPL